MLCKSMPSTSRGAPRGPDGGNRALALRLMKARPSLDVVGNEQQVPSRRVELRHATFGASLPDPLARAGCPWKESNLHEPRS